MFEYDFVKIDLGAPLEGAAPLEIADVVDHEIIYLAGFPAESSNLSLHFSKGIYIPFSEAAKKLGMRSLDMLTEEKKTCDELSILLFRSFIIWNERRPLS